MKYLKVCGRSKVLNEVGGDSSFVTIGLVMEIEHVRLGILVFLILHEVVNRRKVWERLHAEFGVESAPKSIENLILFLRSMPHYATC